MTSKTPSPTPTELELDDPSLSEVIFFETIKVCDQRRLQAINEESLRQLNHDETPSSDPSSSENSLLFDPTSHPHLQWCWILPMARKLGLTDEQALNIVSPFPWVVNIIRRQLDQLNALHSAQRADFRDEVDRALAAYLQHLAAIPFDEDTRLILGRLLIERGERRAAEAIFRAGLMINEGPVLQSLRAELLIADSQFDQAYIFAFEAKERAQDHADVLITYALACLWTGREAEARDTLREALALNPKHPIIQARLLNMTDPNQSVYELFDQISLAYETRPNRYLHQTFVNALIKTQRYELAIQEAQALLLRHPKSLSARISLIKTLFLSGEVDQAWTRALELHEEDHALPGFSLLFCSIASMLSRGEAERETHLSFLESIADRSNLAGEIYAQVLCLDGEYEKAHTLYQRAYDRSPHRFERQRALIDSELSLGHLEEAISLARSLYALNPRSDLARLLLTDALITDMALDEAEGLLLENELDPRGLELKIRVDFMRGRYEQAATSALNLLKRTPHHFALIEYVVNATWQSVHDGIEDRLIFILNQLPFVSRQSPILILFGYLFLELDQVELATALMDEAIERGFSRSLKTQRIQFACALALGTQRYETLLELSEMGVEIAPHLALFWFYHANALWALDRDVEAIAVAQEGSQREGVTLQDLVNLSIWLCELQTPHEALKLCDRIVDEFEATQEDVALIRARANLLSPNIDEKTLLETRELIERWVAESPSAKRYERSVIWALDGDQVSLSGDWITEGVQRHPDAMNLWRLLCRFHRLTDQVGSAIYAMEVVLKDDEVSADDHHILAQLLEESERYIRAHKHYLIAVKLQPQSQEYKLELACFLIRRAQLSEAEVYFRELMNILLDADNQTSELLEMMIQPMNSDHFKRELEGNIEEHKSIERTQNALLFLWLSQTFTYCSAEEGLQLALRLGEEWEDRPIFSGFEGLGYLWTGRSMEALPLLEKGFEVDLYFGVEYARALWDTGERIEAVHTLQKCSQKEKYEPEYIRQLIHYLIELEEGDYAFEQLQSLTLIDPSAEDLSDLEEKILKIHVIH